MSRQYTVPEGTCVYAVGDIHGRLDLLVQLHKLILEDREKRKAKRFVLVYVGDYIDRGAYSREVVELLLRKPLLGFETVHLQGNHEFAMLRFITTKGKKASWLVWGGTATLINYGVPLTDERGQSYPPPALAAMLAERLPDSHRTWLEALPYSHREGDYLFVHAGIRPGRPLERQAPEDMMMIREEFFESPEVFSPAVIFGHNIFDFPLVMPDRIGIDTGAYATGTLTALVLEGTHRFFIQTGT